MSLIVSNSFLYFEFFTGRIPFAFLEDIHQRFVRTYGRAVLSAQAYAMNDEFSRVLGQQMEYYSNDPNADRINRLKGEMSQVIFLSISFKCTYGFGVALYLVCYVLNGHVNLQMRGNALDLKHVCS